MEHLGQGGDGRVGRRPGPHQGDRRGAIAGGAAAYRARSRAAEALLDYIRARKDVVLESLFECADAAADAYRKYMSQPP